MHLSSSLGGHDDTPLDLVKWKAYLRVGRGVIDLGTFILRVVLWVRYDCSYVYLYIHMYIYVIVICICIFLINRYLVLFILCK
jgi:hypothetical protein